jgi:UDP-glucose 4-epimerase
MGATVTKTMLKQYKRVLVTGGLGFIGSHLVDELVSLKKEVTIVDNYDTALHKTVPQGVTLIEADIRHPEHVAEAAKGAELIFHVAANSNGSISVENPRFDFEVNAIGTFNVLEGALKVGAKRVLYVASASVYGIPQYYPMDEKHSTRPFVPYGASKLMGELACLSFFHAKGLPVVMARPFCVYGPGENPKIALVEVSRYLRWHLNHQPIQIVGDMKQKTRDFVHVRDLIQGFLLIADKAAAGEVFNVGSGEETSMERLVDVIGQVTGQTPRVHQIPQITKDTYRLVADITKLRSLGYTPRVSLTDGIRELVQALGKHPELPSGKTIFKEGQQAEKNS